jgi:hypothetical protein
MKKFAVILMFLVFGFLILAVMDAPAFAQAPRGLVGHWPADGNANDVAGGNAGKLRGQVTFSPGFRSQAFTIDGRMGSGILIGNPPNLRLQSLSIVAWVRRADSGKSTLDSELSPTGEIVGFGAGGYVLGMWDDGRLFLSKNLYSIVNTSRLKITDTRFHSVAMTKAQGKVVFYMDDQTESVQDYDPGFTFSSDLVIGATGDFRCPWYGQIDEVAIFDRALSAAEIGEIFRGRPLGDGEADEEVAFAAVPKVLFQSYIGVWEDTKRARQQIKGGLPLEVCFQEPPQSGSAFSLDMPSVITKITTFHWYAGNGASPGSIEVTKSGGGYEKSWPASGVRDFTGSVTVYWVVTPNETLDTGIYEINVTPRYSWSCNKRSQLKGIFIVEGYAAGKGGGVKPPGPKTIVREYPITPEIPVSGQVEAPSQIHKYSFRAEAGQRITVLIQAEPSLGVRTDLYNPARKKVKGITVRMKPPRAATFTFLAKVGGVYEAWVWVKNTKFKNGTYTVIVKLK